MRIIPFISPFIFLNLSESENSNREKDHLRSFPLAVKIVNPQCANTDK